MNQQSRTCADCESCYDEDPYTGKALCKKQMGEGENTNVTSLDSAACEEFSKKERKNNEDTVH